MAQTVYVDDEIRLGVRGAPSSAEKSIAVVSTGDRLTLLKEEGGFIKVRTEEGIEGWVSKGYISSEPPARNLLADLQQQYETLQQQQAALQARLAASEEQEAALNSQLASLQREKSALQQKLALYTAEKEEGVERYAWLLLSVALLALFIGGVILGIRWDKRRVAERIGGLEI